VLAIIPDQFLRSYFLAVSLAIPGLTSPVLLVVGDWMTKVGRRLEGRDEVDKVQGITGEIGLGLVSPLAHPCEL